MLTLGKVDILTFRKREGLPSTPPLALNAVAVAPALDTSRLASPFPSLLPDMGTRRRVATPAVVAGWTSI